MSFSLYEPETRGLSGNGPPLDIGITGGIDRAMAERVASQLASAPDASEIIITVDSHGGEFFAAFDIFVLIDRHRAANKATIVRRAQSAALLVAMAGDERVAEPGAEILLHPTSQEPKSQSRWTAVEHAEAADHLRWLDREFANIVAARCGASPEAIWQEMQNEHPAAPEWCLRHNIITKWKDK